MASLSTRLSGVVLLLPLYASCNQLPSRIEMPELDPAAAAARAMEQYDADHDGQLTTDELTQSALASAMAQFDTNGDGGVSEAEIVTRLESWVEDKGGALFVLPVKVVWRGQGLPEATVRFVPEEFLGDAFHPAEGVTDHYGVANMVHAPEHRPDPEFAQGVAVGLYRVGVTKQENGKEMIPAKYNTETTLGQEVAAGAAGMGQGMVTFPLQ